MSENRTRNQTDGDKHGDRTKLSRVILRTAHLILGLISAFAYLSQQYFPITAYERRASGSTRVLLLALVGIWPFIASWIACHDRVHLTVLKSAAFVTALSAGTIVVIAFFFGMFGTPDWWKVMVVTASQATIYVVLAPLILGEKIS